MIVQKLPVIDLLKGWPSRSLLPGSLVSAASQRALSEHSIAALSYGPDEGYLPLRQSISEWLTHFYRPSAGPVSPDRVAITGGASQNLGCILQTFTDPVYTRNVWMVAPTYYLACRIVEDSGFAGRLRGVPEDAEGIDLEFLEKGLRQSEEEATRNGNAEPIFKIPRPWRKIYKHIIYAVPTFSNPSSRNMSLHHREHLIRLARKYDALIITDDVYDMLQWSPTRGHTLPHPDRSFLPRIVDLDRHLDGGPSDDWGHTISNGSFSKIIGPGMRTGWVETTTPKLAHGVSQTGTSRSGGCPSQIASTFIHEMLISGDLQRHILHVLQPAYARRYQYMMTAIKAHLLPLGVTLVQPDRDVVGGYFIWLTLPPGIDVEVLAKSAKEEVQLVIAEGPLFRVWGDDRLKDGAFKNDVRLCFAWEDEDKLVQGIERLARVLKRATHKT